MDIEDEDKSAARSQSFPIGYALAAKDKVVNLVKNHPYVPIVIIIVLLIAVIYLYVTSSGKLSSIPILSSFTNSSKKGGASTASKELDEELNGTKASEQQKKEIEQLAESIKNKQG